MALGIDYVVKRTSLICGSEEIGGSALVQKCKTGDYQILQWGWLTNLSNATDWIV